MLTRVRMAAVVLLLPGRGTPLLLLEPANGGGGGVAGVDDDRGRLLTSMCAGLRAGGREMEVGGGSTTARRRRSSGGLLPQSVLGTTPAMVGQHAGSESRCGSCSRIQRCATACARRKRTTRSGRNVSRAWWRTGGRGGRCVSEIAAGGGLAGCAAGEEAVRVENPNLHPLIRRRHGLVGQTRPAQASLANCRWAAR
jgi:hypothetical protein